MTEAAKEVTSGAESDLDDVTFLPEDSGQRIRSKRTSRYIPLFADCLNISGKRLCIILLSILISILLCLLIYHVSKTRRSNSESVVDTSVDRFYTENSINSSSSTTSDASKATRKHHSTNGVEFPWQSVRLPSHLKAIHYDLLFDVNFANFTFNGQVNITFQSLISTDELLFHSKHLKFEKIFIFEQENQQQPNVNHLNENNFSKDDTTASSTTSSTTSGTVSSTITNRMQIEQELECEELELIYLKMKSKIHLLKNYVIFIQFEGILHEQMWGFYRSSYKDANGVTRWLATTHFEPTTARAAFPCFDEPNLKATFSIRIVRAAQFAALSNMPLLTTTPYDERFCDTFAVSVPMSTYLVAFIVADFGHVAHTVKRKNEKDKELMIRVWAPKHQINQTDFAMKVASDVIPYYEEFFGVEYPLAKADLVAIPDFSAGAMENWGLITFRQTALLIDETISSQWAKQWVAKVIAHELAHQWFGNLVTMRWWNDLWLNEGFASYVEFIGADHFKPEWQLMDDFLVDTTLPALLKDSSSFTHPVSVSVEDPREIDELFDSISYKKGASLIRMVSSFLGDASLQKGLQNYLHKFQLQNADTTDLWNSLESAVDHELPARLGDIMNSWTLQEGYPLVTVTRKQNNQLLLRQERFYYNSRAPRAAQSQSWSIPITFMTSNSNQQKRIWLAEKEATLTLDEPAAWVKVNLNYSGFYRVNYDAPLWNGLTVNFRTLSTADRASLLADSFTLARSQLAPIELFLNLSRHVKAERTDLVWSVTLNAMSYIEKFIESHSMYKYFEKYLTRLMVDTFHELGIAEIRNEPSHLASLRVSLLSRLCYFRHAPCVTLAKSEYTKYTEDPSYNISSNLKALIISTVIREGGDKEWNAMWNRYVQEKVASERDLYLGALAYAEDATKLQQLLEWSLDPEKVKAQDTVSVITTVAGNPKGASLAWSFATTNWAELANRYGETSFTMTSLIRGITGRLYTEQDLNMVRSFLSTHPAGLLNRSLLQTFEAVECSYYFMKQYESALNQWLMANSEALH